MPNDNIERAIKRGTGEGTRRTISTKSCTRVMRRGVAVIVEAATDNRNRTAAEVRRIFTKNAG